MVNENFKFLYLTSLSELDFWAVEDLNFARMTIISKNQFHNHYYKFLDAVYKYIVMVINVMDNGLLIS